MKSYFLKVVLAALLDGISGDRSGIVRLATPIRVRDRTFTAVKIKGAFHTADGKPAFPDGRAYHGIGQTVFFHQKELAIGKIVCSLRENQ